MYLRSQSPKITWNKKWKCDQLNMPSNNSFRFNNMGYDYHMSPCYIEKSLKIPKG